MRAGSVAAGTRLSSRPTTATSCRSQPPGRASRRGASALGAGAAWAGPRHREEVLDPAVVRERLERRDPPVLRARGGANPEHHGRPEREVDPRIARVPEEADVPGPATGERIPPAPVDTAGTGRKAGQGDAPGDRDERARQREAREPAADVRRTEHERCPERRPERERAEEDGVGVLEQHGGKADAGRDRGNDDPRPPERRPERRDEGQHERRHDDEAVKRGDVRRVEGRLHRRRVAEAVPGVAQTAVRPRLEGHGEGGRADHEGAHEPPPPIGEESRHERERARGDERARCDGRLEQRPRIRHDRDGGCGREHGPEGESVSQRPSPEGRPARPRATCRAGGRRAPRQRPRAGAAPGRCAQAGVRRRSPRRRRQGRSDAR